MAPNSLTQGDSGAESEVLQSRELTPRERLTTETGHSSQKEVPANSPVSADTQGGNDHLSTTLSQDLLC
jgi:hypothetical protein